MARSPATDPTSAVRQIIITPDDDGIRLDRWFHRHQPAVGFATIARWARTGQLRLDGKRVAPETRLATGQMLRVPPHEPAREGAGQADAPWANPTPATFSDEQRAAVTAMLLYRDAAAIVLNKPPGLATQGGSGTREHVDGLLVGFVRDEALRDETRRDEALHDEAGGADDAPDAPDHRPRLVHRLDKDTSGVLLVAATPASAAFFAKHFAARAARKLYWALVIGVPEPDERLIDLPLAKQPGSGGEKMAVDPRGQPAQTRYRVIDRVGSHAAWVELSPLTGRTHQLRAHMAAIGHPIVGDGKYGGATAFLSGSISRKLHLHARRLVIAHPDGATLDVTAPLPAHFAASLAQLGLAAEDGMAEDGAAPGAVLTPGAPKGQTTAKPADKATLKQDGKAHAKHYRKERRGERRARVSGARGKAPGSAARPFSKKPR